MTEKKAFVFDTNFIVKYQQLDEVIKRLEDEFSVYVTQVSIDERIAQQCRETKTKFEKIEEYKSTCARFANIKLKKTYEEMCDYLKNSLQEKYEKSFHDRVIPFEKNESVFSLIIDRANKKLPPFSDAQGASDKGFKDCLLWISLIAYFKSNGENDIVFVSDDNAFGNKTDYLCKEFSEETGKSIEFKSNSFYKDYLVTREASKNAPENASLPENLNLVRDEINTVITGLCVIETENYYGDINLDSTFITTLPFDKNYVKIIFDGLEDNIRKHIFEKEISASKVFDLDGRLVDDKAAIPIQNLEQAVKTYKKIISKYPEFVDQFYEAAALIFNKNYVKMPDFSNDEELPF